MKRAIVLCCVPVASVAIAAWFWSRGTSVEISFGDPWPQIVRGVGESVERINSGPDGRVTNDDVARATERARWKAYYYAQLRLAEQIGDLQIDSNTTIRDTELSDQELRAAFSGIVHAAPEVESKGSVEKLGDGVRARVVVEARQAELASLRELAMRLLRSGRITVKREPRPIRDSADTAQASEASVKQGNGERVARTVAHGKKSELKGHELGASSQTEAPEVVHTGCAVIVRDGSDFVGAVPDFYDAKGTFLGSSLDLPADRRTAGIPIASGSEPELVSKWVGSDPMRLRASVSSGNVILEDTLSAEEGLFFRECLHRVAIVLVLEEK